MRRVRVQMDKEIYPATIVAEDAEGTLDVADSIWERYLAAVAEMMSDSEVAEELGVTKQRVQQIRTTALATLAGLVALDEEGAA